MTNFPAVMFSMIERVKQSLWTTVYEPMGAYIVCLEILIYWSQILVNSITLELFKRIPLRTFSYLMSYSITIT